jgi:L-rhamnose isomerase
MNLPKIAVHLGVFAGVADRYSKHGYPIPPGGEERVRQLAGMQGLEAVELNFRGTLTEESVPSVLKALNESSLKCANVSMNVWDHRKWCQGSLSNNDHKSREEAIELIIQGMQTAQRLNSTLVSLWPGQDGFDYPFEANYGKMMDWFVGGIQTCADSDPKMRICIEYKPKEPRAHSLVDTASRLMWMLTKINRANVGVLLDVGHGLEAYENVAQTAVLLKREGWLDLIHFNDNYGEWDWDLIPGTVRFWELLELIFWLNEIGYQGYNSIDIVAPRFNPVEAVQLSVLNIQRLFRLVDILDPDLIRDNLTQKNSIANLRYISDRIFKSLEE